ncbi:MAG: class I SAM-dependent methyltransferase [Candidatus Zixiibacteriota bacterium]
MSVRGGADDDVRRELDRQADARASLMIRWDDVARAIREISGLRPTDRVLDVACGDGLLAFELAPHCAYVRGVDLSDSMIALAAERTIESGVPNVSFQVGTVETLEFEDASFDRVYCRLGLHHFAEPRVALNEMIRVVKKPGHIILADLVSSEDPARRDAHNRIEKSRDPTHVAMLSPRQMRALVAESGLSLEREVMWETRRRFNDWMRLIGADKGRIDRTRRLMLEAARRGSTDLKISGGGNSLEFSHRWMVMLTLALA